MGMHIRRTDPPAWLARNETVDDRPWRELTGEQAEWGYMIPQMYRVLASPDTGHELLRAPEPGDNHMVAAAYWTGLLHLTTYSLGWIRPERGITAWHREGQPTDDVRLQLLAEVWAGDGMLDWFHAWTHQRLTGGVTVELGELVGFVDDDEDSEIRPGWADEQRRLADRSGLPAPCMSGGGDMLHLSGHFAGPLQEPPGEVDFVRTDSKRRRAVLLVDSMVGWYRALCSAGETLPDVDSRSWRVELVVRPVGSLGVYRRSRETGIWFAGRHRYHELGIGKHSWKNPPPLSQP